MENKKQKRYEIYKLNQDVINKLNAIKYLENKKTIADTLKKIVEYYFNKFHK